MIIKGLFCLFLHEKLFCGCSLDPVVEAILISTHKIHFYEDLTKITFQLSSNTHLISSGVFSAFICSKTTDQVKAN